MPNWTLEQLKSTKAGAKQLNAPAPHPGHGTATGVQKLQDAHTGQADNGSQKPEVDEGSGGQYRFSIIVQVSDASARDGDGCCSTLLDCVIHARRRLLSLPDCVLLALYARAKEARRSSFADRED
jgi:hypothetical protein